MTIRIRTPFDAVATVPILLGFVPEDSLVFMVSEAAGRQFHMRADLPTSIEECDILVGQILPTFEREGVTAAVLFFFTPQATNVAEHADHLTGRLSRVDVKEVFHVTPTHYRSLRCPNTDCCPPGGTPYDFATHPEIAEAVLAGRVVLQTLTDVANSLEGPITGGVTASFDAHDKLGMEQIPLLSPGHPNHDPDVMKRFRKGEALWVQRTLRRCRQDEEMLPDAGVGRIAAALLPNEVRDVAWAQITTETAPFFKEFFRDLTRRVPADAVAAPASLFAFACWMAGDGASARIGIERALEVEPNYGMALLIHQALALRMNPATFRAVDEYDLSVWDVA